MFKIVKYWKLMFATLCMLLLFAYNYHKNDNKPISPRDKLDEAQVKTDKIKDEILNSSNHRQYLLPRGKMGVFAHFAYNIVRPFIETRIDAYVAGLGLQERFREYTDVTTASITTKDVKEGTGGLVACGSKVDIVILHEEQRYISGVQQNLLPTQNGTFIIGGGSLSRGLELGVIGMHEGGVRAISVPYQLLINRNFIHASMLTIPQIDYVVKVIKVYNEYPAIAHDFMRFDHVTSIGKEIKCGDKVAFDIRIFDANGKVVYNNREAGKFLELRPGVHSAPLGIELGLIGMRSNGTRIAVIPAPLLKADDSTIDEVYRTMQFHAGQASLVELKVLDITS